MRTCLAERPPCLRRVLGGVGGLFSETNMVGIQYGAGESEK